MTLNPEQCRALVDAIALAGSVDALNELRRVVACEHGRAVAGGFLELLIDVRLSRLERSPPVPARMA
jgi:hypothetical protein